MEAGTVSSGTELLQVEHIAPRWRASAARSCTSR